MEFDLTYLEIPIAAIAAFLLGFLWYTALFGKAWQAETGITDEQAQSGIAITHGLAFLMMNVIAWGMWKGANVYHDIAEQTFVHGSFHGAMTALKLALPAVAIHYLYQKKSLKLFLIDGGYLLAFFTLMAAVMYQLKL